MRGLITALGLAAAVWTSPVQAAAKLVPGQPVPVEQLEAFVDGMVRDAMDADHVAGATVAVVQGGQVRLLKGWGFSDLKRRAPVDPARTMFRIGSTSKTFTWILLLREIEQGRVKLDAPVNAYLPAALRIPDQGFETPILVRHLLDHSAGFEDSSAGHLFVDRPERLLPTDDYLVRYRPRRVREPGLFSTYSNYGVALAGRIVAQVEGRDFPTVVEQRLTGPLGMTHTSFREPYAPRAGLPAPMAPALAAELSTGFDWSGGRWKARGVEYIGQIAPAGAASATAADMARYMLMQLGGGTFDGVRIYGERTAKALRTPIRPPLEGVNGWAHGYMITNLPGGFAGYGHDGSTQSFKTQMILVPELDLGLFVSTNTATGAGLWSRLTRGLVAHWYARPDAGLPRPGDPNLGKNAARFEGHYRTSRRSYSGLEGFLWRLTSSVEVTVSKDGYLLTKSDRGAQAWVRDGAPGRFRAAVGEGRMVFTPDARRYEMSAGTASFERYGWLEDVRLLQALAIASLAASVAVLVGTLRRRRWEPLEVASVAVAAAWLAAFALMAAWAPKASDRLSLLYDFPGAPLMGASIAALAATVGTALWALASLVARRRCWAAVPWLALGLILASWGALTPWS